MPSTTHLRVWLTINAEQLRRASLASGSEDLFQANVGAIGPTAFLLYVTVAVAVTWIAFTMGTMICKVVCDDPIRQKLKAASVYSEASEFGA